MQSLVLVLHVLLAVALIALVLIQHGKGADIGAAFGSGASNTVFGSQGSLSFLFKLTMLFAILFGATSIFLGYVVNHQQKSPVNTVATAPVQTSAPVTLTIHAPKKS